MRIVVVVVAMADNIVISGINKPFADVQRASLPFVAGRLASFLAGSAGAAFVASVLPSPAI